MKKILFGFAILLLAGGIFYVGVMVGTSQYPAIKRVESVLNQETLKPEEVDFSLFWDVWSRLEDEYVDHDKIDREKLVYGAISGMVKAVGDPYTTFFPPVESKRFQEDVSGSFSGIGAEIGIRKDVLTIVTPLKGSPAERAGIMAGDKVLKINATSTAELSLEEAVGFIRGPKGTEVTLTVSRNGSETIKDITITRDTIVVPVIETKKIGNDVFYIHLLNFNETSSVEFRKALQEMLLSGRRKLIFDVRNNPGGYLHRAIDIASWFLPAGEAVSIERRSDGYEFTYRSSGNKFLETMPVVVLINEGSASASEIVAGALRDIRGITLVGEKTFGKGSVQEYSELPRGTSIKITVAKWLTPKGTSINDTGIEPDVEVKRTPEDVENDRDPQLDKAVEVLRGIQ
ncbi:MAG: S41 family peptidase [bacterium]|nr:S41 family peptidase [bacterium]